MMSLPELALAVLLLLLTPGPTNTLVLLAGAERGLIGALRLIPAELAGYLLSVVPLTLAGAALLEQHAVLRVGLTLAAAAWVAVLALKLWRVPNVQENGRSVTAKELLVTTALNPKSLILGLVLLPAPGDPVASLALFGGLVVLVAGVWAGVGATLRGRVAGVGGQPRALFVLRRLASVWLAAISLLLAARGMGA